MKKTLSEIAEHSSDPTYQKMLLVLSSKKTNDWQRNFVKDLIKRDSPISFRQEDALNRILEQTRLLDVFNSLSDYKPAPAPVEETTGAQSAHSELTSESIPECLQPPRLLAFDEVPSNNYTGPAMPRRWEPGQTAWLPEGFIPKFAKKD